MPLTPPSNETRPYHAVGHYRVVRHIATGGMGVIYRAVDERTGEEVALKVLSPMLAVKEAALERFRREANRGVKLRHENIVEIKEFGESNGTYFMAQEFVAGIDLHEYVNQQGQLDPEEARLLLTQAARALDYLHQNHVVHRDIKPSNFLLTQIDEQPHLKLTDLGLAREIGDSQFRVTRSGNTVGTIDYMAPEQARDSGLADIRSDIYSLGCTLYHMLAGHPPFPNGGLTERLYKHVEEEPPDVRVSNPVVPAFLVYILRRMLRKKPEQRYQTPAELLEDLARMDRGEVGTSAASDGAHRDKNKGKSPALELPQAESATAPWATPTQETIPVVRSDSATLATVTDDQRRVAAGQFERANQVLSLSNFDYGIHLLLSCCQLDPANLTFRKRLRRVERLRYRHNRRGSRFAWLTNLAAKTKLRSATRAGDHLQVLDHGENVLVRNPWDVPTQIQMADAAENLGLFSLAIWLLEQAWQKDTHTPTLNRALARVYEKRSFFTNAINLWKLVLQADPNDFEAHQKVKDLAARETIMRGQYEHLVDTRTDP